MTAERNLIKNALLIDHGSAESSTTCCSMFGLAVLGREGGRALLPSVCLSLCAWLMARASNIS